MALLFIIIGAVFDFFDGMTARLLHVSSPIGKELDSLADVITFGFAPSAVVFSFLCSFHIHIYIVPFLAFVMAAFSALHDDSVLEASIFLKVSFASSSVICLLTNFSAISNPPF